MLQGLKLGYVNAVMPAAWSCVQMQKVQPLSFTHTQRGYLPDSDC